MKNIKIINKVKYTRQIFVFCILGILLNSCSNFLDEEPISQVSDATFWETGDDANFAIAGAYSQLRKALNSGLQKEILDRNGLML